MKDFTFSEYSIYNRMQTTLNNIKHQGGLAFYDLDELRVCVQMLIDNGSDIEAEFDRSYPIPSVPYIPEEITEEQLQQERNSQDNRY